MSLAYLLRDQESRIRETMIINPLNIYSSPSKTDQIMSRYRPIAPKPQLPMHQILESPSLPQKTQQPPFLRNLSPHLQTRPPRSRKRTKGGFSPVTNTRARTLLPECSSPSHAASLANTTLFGLSMQGFAHGLPPVPIHIPRARFDGGLEKPTQASANLVPLSLLPHPSTVPVIAKTVPAPNGINYYPHFEEKVLELNSMTELLQEKDLLQKLLAPNCGNVIAPQPVRPVGSSISVGCISEDPRSGNPVRITKKPEEVEEEVESEALPAIVSDSNNRVRMANSAYKEMVGQPECLWLDTIYNEMSRVSACKRISGKVMLNLLDSSVPVSSNGFSCRVRIEWGNNGQKSSINAPCDVIRLSCKSKDYLFTWRVMIVWGNNEQKSSMNAPYDVIRPSCDQDYLFTWRVPYQRGF